MPRWRTWAGKRLAPAFGVGELAFGSLEGLGAWSLCQGTTLEVIMNMESVEGLVLGVEDPRTLEVLG